jgi:hypothetical protein
VLKFVGLGFVVVGAFLILQVPLLGWVFGGLLVFIGLSLLVLGWMLPMMREGARAGTRMMNASAQVMEQKAKEMENTSTRE